MSPEHAAMTKDEAQRSIRAFYEAVKDDPMNHDRRRLPHRPKRWRMARNGCRQVILGPANRITSRIRAFISGL